MQTSDQPERSTAKDTLAPALVGSNLAEERSARHPRARSHRLAGIEAAEETYLAGMAHYATTPPQTESNSGRSSDGGNRGGERATSPLLSRLPAISQPQQNTWVGTV